ncbi:hypothetical protein [Nonomuraea dietziae]|uniref:hypothetical protein n=1 Tax=Nonomuraea dietziae TaxID=65515 RepID=UPI0031E3CC4C
MVFLVGAKFGTQGAEHATWFTNSYLPGRVANRFRDSRIAALSTGNVYPLVPVTSGGATEETPADPVGEYAMSCLGRERVMSHFSEKYGTRLALIRLNYAVEMRYGVLVDLAQKVHAGEPIDVSTGMANVVWQGYVNEVTLRALLHAQAPPFTLNLTGPELISVRQAATDLGRAMGKEPSFVGEEANTALLSNAARCHRLFGYPELAHRRADRAHRALGRRRRPLLGKPTKVRAPRRPVLISMLIDRGGSGRAQHGSRGSDVRPRLFRRGLVIPAHPLALDAGRKLDERRQRALTRYYVRGRRGRPGRGCPHHAVRHPRHRAAAAGVSSWRRRPPREAGREIVMVAGATGPTRAGRGRGGARQVARLPHGAAQPPQGAERGPADRAARAVGEVLPVIGFYLQPAVGGRTLSRSFWTRLASIESVRRHQGGAVRPLPHARRAARVSVRAGRAGERGALHRQRRPHLADLITTPPGDRGRPRVEVEFVGGLLGQWAVWVKKAVELLEEAKLARAGDDAAVRRLLGLDGPPHRPPTPPSLDSAIRLPRLHPRHPRDPAPPGAAGRALVPGTPAEELSPGQLAEIDRVWAATRGCATTSSSPRASTGGWPSGHAGSAEGAPATGRAGPRDGCRPARGVPARGSAGRGSAGGHWSRWSGCRCARRARPAPAVQHAAGRALLHREPLGDLPGGQRLAAGRLTGPQQLLQRGAPRGRPCGRSPTGSARRRVSRRPTPARCRCRRAATAPRRRRRCAWPWPAPCAPGSRPPPRCGRARSHPDHLARHGQPRQHRQAGEAARGVGQRAPGGDQQMRAAPEGGQRATEGRRLAQQALLAVDLDQPRARSARPSCA